jgi:hypothetical protein
MTHFSIDHFEFIAEGDSDAPHIMTRGLPAVQAKIWQLCAVPYGRFMAVSSPGSVGGGARQRVGTLSQAADCACPRWDRLERQYTR